MATVKQALNGKSLETKVRTGLPFQRYFTDGRTWPFDAVEWDVPEGGPDNQIQSGKFRATAKPDGGFTIIRATALSNGVPVASGFAVVFVK